MVHGGISLKSLLEHIPPEAVYRREPLDDRLNALVPWRQAVEHFVMPDDKESDLWGRLIYGEGGQPAALPPGTKGQAVRDLVERNSQALRLLAEGVRRGRVQFPEIHGFDQITEQSEFVFRLGELARLPLIHCKVLLADGDLGAAADELVALLHIGEMVCNGGGQVLHYLIGLWSRSTALRGIGQLAARQDVSTEVLAKLLSAVVASARAPDGLADCLRADLCCVSLPQLARMPEDEAPPMLVDELLRLFYVGGPARFGPQATDEHIISLPQRSDWRREQILFLLDGHPKPFDKAATARLMGEMVADSVRDLEQSRQSPVRGIPGRARCHFRRRRLARQMGLWPAELAPGLTEPWPETDDEPTVLGESAGTGENTAGDSAPQPLDGAQLAEARDKLRRVANPVGLILAGHLLAFDYRPFAWEHHAKLKQTRQMLAKRLKRVACS